MNRNADHLPAVDTASPWLSGSALQRFQQPIVDYLLCGLTDDDKRVRILAARMLGNTGDPRVKNHLQQLLTNRDPDIRMAAADSLVMLSSPMEGLPSDRGCGCTTCMIRLIADEAIRQLRTRLQIARHP